RIDLAEVVHDRAQSRISLAAEVEVVQPVGAVGLAARNAVEVLFEGRGEVVVDERAEVALEQPDHAEREPRRHEGLTALAHIAAVEDHTDDAREGRRTSAPPLLESLDERSL